MIFKPSFNPNNSVIPQVIVFNFYQPTALKGKDESPELSNATASSFSEIMFS